MNGDLNLARNLFKTMVFDAYVKNIKHKTAGFILYLL